MKTGLTEDLPISSASSISIAESKPQNAEVVGVKNGQWVSNDHVALCHCTSLISTLTCALLRIF